MLHLQLAIPPGLPRPVQLRFRPLGQIQEERGMPIPDRFDLATGGQALPAVLAEDLEQAVARRSLAARLDDDERLVRQAREQVQHLVRLDAVAGADRLGRLERPPAREH